MLSANSGSGEAVNSGIASSIGELVIILAGTEVNMDSGVGLSLTVDVRVGREVGVSLIVVV
jgi:hypothetical protein